MAPNYKVTKEQIIDAGLEIAKESGLESITTRAIGNKLGLSNRPAYSFFPSVDDLKSEVVKRISDLLSEQLRVGQSADNPFLSVGLSFVRFARENKEFYKILHSSGSRYYDKYRQTIEDMVIANLQSTDQYRNVPKNKMKDLFLKMGIFTHGLADFMFQDTSGRYSISFVNTILKETGRALVADALQKKEEVKI